MFIKKRAYKRSDLHKEYGGQEQSGICTPKNHDFILLFNTPNGKDHGYHDKWDEDFGAYHYSGQGQSGDMEFKSGNKAIRDHLKNGKTLYLFSAIPPKEAPDRKKGFVVYIGEFVYVGYHEEIDLTEERRIIIFELKPIDQGSDLTEDPTPPEIQTELDQWDQVKLRERAMAAAVSSRISKEIKRDYYYRSEAIKQYALSRANGTCEACEKPAPFQTNNNLPYLEVHHIRRLADSGPDDPYWVVGICPNCHRRAHYSIDAKHFNKRLEKIAHQKEDEIEKRKQVAG